MKFNSEIPVYGDVSFRGQCPKEDAESMTLVNQVRKLNPDVLFMHIKNEGKKTKAQADFDKAMGLLAGASDFIFLGSPPLLLEMKRKDHTLCSWQPNQQEFLIKAKKNGCMVCVALGYKAALQAFEEWRILNENGS